jgi:hypothetical protein
MFGLILQLFRLIWLFVQSHRALVLENLALRQQLAIFGGVPMVSSAS